MSRLVNRICCDGLCTQGRDCPLDFKDTVPRGHILEKTMRNLTDFPDTEPCAEPGKDGHGIVLAAVFMLTILLLLGAWHAYS